MDLSASLEHPLFKTIGAVADRQSLKCYVVGGYVRDLLLKRPSKDIDFVCVGSGIELAQAVAKEFGPGVNVTIFKNFGTAQIVYEDMELEFVGAINSSCMFKTCCSKRITGYSFL